MSEYCNVLEIIHTEDGVARIWNDGHGLVVEKYKINKCSSCGDLYLEKIGKFRHNKNGEIENLGN